MMRTPRARHLTRRLWARIQEHTARLTCQGALSPTSSSASVPAAWSWAQHHSRYAAVADSLLGQPLLEADLGDEVERPQAGRLPERARALVQQGAEAFGTDRVEGRPDDLGTVRAEPRGGHAPLVERLDRLAHRL